MNTSAIAQGVGPKRLHQGGCVCWVSRDPRA
jgi:hypothetical protein